MDEDAKSLSEMGYGPGRIARIRVEGRLVETLDILDEAIADLDDLPNETAVRAAISAARHDIVEAMRCFNLTDP